MYNRYLPNGAAYTRVSEPDGPPPPPPGPSAEEILLTEIRDLLKEQKHV